MKLNLRDLFWLILVAAVATLWGMDRTNLAKELAVYKTRPQTGGLLEQVEWELAVLRGKIKRTPSHCW